MIFFLWKDGGRKGRGGPGGCIKIEKSFVF